MSSIRNFFEHDPALTPILRKLSYHAKLSANDVHELQKLIRKRARFKRGEAIIQRGTHTRNIYVISEGVVSQEMATEAGTNCIIGFLVAGDTTEINSSLNASSDVTIKCLTAVQAIQLSADEFKAVLHSNPTLSRAFTLVRLSAESRTRELLMNLAAKPADQKIAHLLCELSLRAGNVRPDDESVFDIPLTQTELAQALGLSSVHVNRTFKRLREAGLIDLVGGSVRILDWNRLAELCSYDSRYMTQHHGNGNLKDDASDLLG